MNVNVLILNVETENSLKSNRDDIGIKKRCIECENVDMKAIVISVTLLYTSNSYKYTDT